MRQCPKCKEWTLDFDGYFGRFRCYSSECGWMPASSAERRINRLREHKSPQEISSFDIRETDIHVHVFYDDLNDVLIFNFGEDALSFDMPEDNGRVLWKVAFRTGKVTGFKILDAKELGVSAIEINLTASKQSIESEISAFPATLGSGRITRDLIERVSVTVHAEESARHDEPLDEAVNRFISDFDRLGVPAVC